MWIPFTLDFGALAGFTRPILDRFRRETGSEQPEEYFDYDFRTVREKYGRDLTLCACISAQKLFPFGAPDEIKIWVKEMESMCEPDRRVIFCPSNAIQPETPWENIAAFVEASKREESH